MEDLRRTTTGPRPQPVWLRYGAAVLAVAVMAGVRSALTPAIGPFKNSFLTFWLAVLFAAIYCGLGPALLSIVLSAFAAIYLFIEPGGQPLPQSTADYVSVGGFILVALGIALLGGAARSSHRRLVESLHVAEAEAEARKASEERMRQVIETTLDASVSMNVEGIITGWNQAAERMFGWTREGAIGKRMSDLIIPPEYRQAHEAGLKRFRETGEAPVVGARLTLSALRRDGAEFPIELTVSLLREGDDVSFSAFIRDITVEAALQEARERLTITLKSIGDAVIATDRHANVTFMNHVAEGLTGWTLAEAHGKPATEVFNIINEQTGEPVEAPYDKVLREGVVVGLANHTVLIDRSGVRRAIEDSGAPIRDAKGEIMGVVLVFHDVTARRDAESNRQFLAEAGEILASSLDYDETLARVAQLATPRVADWCAIDMLDQNGDLQRLATAHVDPEKVKYVLELSERYPTDKDADLGSYAIVRTGKSQILPVIPKELLEEAAIDEEHLRIIRELDLRSYMGVPIKLRDQVLGVIVFVAAESGRTYTTEDLQFAEQLASRAAIAVDNAKLFTQLRQEVDARAVREQQQAAIADLGHKALAGADVKTLMDETVQMVAATMQTDSACVIQIDPDGQQAVLLSGYGWSAEKIGTLKFDASPGSRTHYVCSHRNPLGYEDLSADERFSAESGLLDEGMKGGMACVLEVAGKPWGVVQAHTRRPRRFTNQDTSFLQTVANVLTTALERQKAEEAVSNLAAIVESSTDAIFSADVNGVLTNWNSGSETVFGYTADEAIGQHMTLLAPVDRKHEVDAKFARLLRGELVDDYETVRVRKDGTDVDVSISATPITDASGHVVGVSVIARDITERKLAEEIQRQLVEAIETERQRLTGILATVPGVVWEAWGTPDAVNQRIDFVSNYVESMLGYSVEEWLSQPNFWLRIVHPDDQERAVAEATATFLSGQVGTSQFRWVRKDGEAIWVHAHSIAIKDEQGKPVGMRGVTLDISDLKKAELAIAESEERFRNLADSAPVLIWLGAADGECTYVNRGWLDFTGRSMAEQLGTGWADSIHPDDRAKCLTAYSNAFTVRRPFDIEYRMRRHDGEYRWLLSRGIPRFTAAGEFEGYIGSGVDITEQLQAADALRDLNLDLERRVRERTAELEAANTELEAFSYSVSHDLRAPLRALDGFSRILLEDHAATLDSEAQDYLARIRAASQRMAQLIEDLLNLAYVTRTEMHREPVDLSQMLQGIADELNQRQPEKPVEFSVAQDMKVNGDARLIRAAMDNLMQNAWKFSSKTDSPRVEAGMNGSAFYIRDNGAGFDPAFANKLFLPFQRLHNASEFPGSGVGLATVQRIIYRHGGTIQAQGEVGKGATIYFTL